MANIPGYNFGRHEFACNCGCGFDAVDIELLGVLQIVREHFNRSVHITSGCRCEARNRDTRGAAHKSQHPRAKAADFWVRDTHPDDVADFLESKYPHKYGIGRYSNRTHIDVRWQKARWDRRKKR